MAGSKVIVKRRQKGWRLALVAGVLACLPGLSRAAEPPRRIVSLNLCIDPIVLDLVPRDRIKGVSANSADPNVSPIVDRVAGLNQLRGGGEEVLALDPDLVLAGAYTTPATIDLLRRLGRRVEVVPLATDIEGIRSVVRQIAAAVGEPEHGEAIIGAFDRKLAGSKATDAKRPSALLYQMGSLVSGPNSLVDAAFDAAGFQNKADMLLLGPGGHVGLETLLIDPPDLIVLGQSAATYRTRVADNLRHPALAHLLSMRPHVDLPMPLWLCGTPQLAEAVALLVKVRAGLLARDRN